MKTFTVYKYTFPDGKIYIGVTGNSISKRRDNGYNHNKPLKKALKEAGWKNVKVDILATCADQESAFSTEQQMIAVFEATNPDIGYNVSKGGKATFKSLSHSDEAKAMMSERAKGAVFTEEHKRNISNALKGNQKICGVNNPMFGKPKSAETIKKQYLAHKGSMKAIIQKDLAGNIIAEFDSLHQAEKATGVFRNCITACANGKQKSSKGFLWEFKEVV